MNAMVQVEKTALDAMEQAKTIVFLALEEEELFVIIVLVLAEKGVHLAVGREEIHGITLLAPAVMVEDIEIVMIATEVGIRNVVCVGVEVIIIAFHVMAVVMMIVINVMDMENCVWNVTDVMDMEN